MDVSLLRHFLAVAQQGSFTLAADGLGVSQPGLSRQVQRLERELGVVLFRRVRGGVELTAAGERYRAFAEDVLARHRALLAELRGAESSLRGPLRIAASTTPGEFLVPQLVAQFTELHPDVHPIVFTTDSEGVVDDLARRNWDLGFVGARIERRGIRFDPIAEDEVVLAVPAHHPFARQGEVTLDALADQRFLEREGGSGTLLSVRRMLAERGLALPAYQVGMTLSSTQAIVASVRAGYGIGFVSSLALTGQAAERVVAVRLVGLPIRRSLYLAREEQRLLPPVALRFAEYVLGRTSDGATHLDSNRRTVRKD